MTRVRAALEGGLCGAAVSLGLLAINAASLGRLGIAGVSDAAAQERLVQQALPAVVMLELRLALLHFAAGLVLGALAGLAVAGSRSRRLTAAALVTLGLFALAGLGMMGRYPQLYADRFWLAGGLRAFVQRFATHVAGPRLFDGLFLLTLAGLAARALARVPPRVWRDRRTLALGAAGLLLAGLALSPPPWSAFGRRAASRRPNVLLIVVDSLRTDRILSPEVMPAVAGLASSGTLFRHAFTPIARTVPSWVSLLTGAEPRNTGVRTMFPELDPRRDTGSTFVTELRDAGYRTFVVSDFAGDMFPRLRAGFDELDTPTLDAERLARATVLEAHAWSLPFLRLAWLREALPEWRNLASLSDPQWLVDRALARARREPGRPFAGAVFFGTSHFPYVAPYPDYLWRAGAYAGPYLYHAPPALGERQVTPADVEQVRARYDGALRATDRSIERLLSALRRDGALDDTIVVVTGDHGEELYEEPGIAGHGDTIGAERSQVVPILLVGPGVERGRVRDDQVRLYDLAATLLDLSRGRSGGRFGDGLDLRVEAALRPACLETGIWFFPGLPRGLQGHRLEYPGIAELLELERDTGAFALSREWVPSVEGMKARGLVLGDRLFTDQLTPSGRSAGLRRLPGIPPSGEGIDVAALFDERCVCGDRSLDRYLDAVVWTPARDAGSKLQSGMRDAAGLSGCSPTPAAHGRTR